MAVVFVVGIVPAATAAAGPPAIQGVQQVETNTTAEPGQALTGQQLATVIAVTDNEVSEEVASAAVESALTDATEAEQAAILADRAADLRDRAIAINDARASATEAYRTGDLSRDAYAQRLAVLSARATTVDTAFQQVNTRANEISPLELQAAGFNRSANQAAQEQLDRMTGSGTVALLAQFTGQSSGEYTLESNGGITIETESEDGERSREFERPQPGDGRFTVDGSEALSTARETLTDEYDGEWTLRSLDRDDDGYYEFAFRLTGGTVTGEAEVSVDGATGEVFELEEEIERPGAAADGDDRKETETLSLSIVEGSPEAGATIVLSVTANGSPVADATVAVDDGTTTTTDADGQATIALPNAEEAEIEVTAGEQEGELELSLQEESEDERDAEAIRQNLNVESSTANGTITLQVTYQDTGVENVTAYVDDEPVGTTDANGELSFTPATTEDDDVEVTLIKGEFETEIEFEPNTEGLTAEEQDRDDEDEEEANEAADDDEATDDDEMDDEQAEQEADEDETAEDDDGDEDESEEAENDDEDVDEEIDDGEAGDEGAERDDT